MLTKFPSTWERFSTRRPRFFKPKYKATCVLTLGNGPLTLDWHNKNKCEINHINRTSPAGSPEYCPKLPLCKLIQLYKSLRLGINYLQMYSTVITMYGQLNTCTTKGLCEDTGFIVQNLYSKHAIIFVSFDWCEEAFVIYDNNSIDAKKVYFNNTNCNVCCIKNYYASE